MGADRPGLIARLRGVRAVLLDMDGTLVDSDAAVERAWARWCDEFGVPVAVVLAIAHGAPADRTVRTVLPGLTEPHVLDAAAKQLALQYDDVADVVPTPGARELLDTLDRHAIPWVVVTSADRRLAAARLTAAGFEASVLVTVEDVVRGKPDPEGYLRAARLLGVPPAACLVVEDAEPGVLAGRAAGSIVAALKGLDADIRLSDLSELARFITASREPGSGCPSARSSRRVVGRTSRRS